MLFDIDGVIRDVGGSYRRAIAETVRHYGGWIPDLPVIDALKAEGHWNNDWAASLELLRRGGLAPLPSFEELVEVFSGFYFGGDPQGPPDTWQGFIRDEPLLVEPGFFSDLHRRSICWGFVSGSEPASARFVLETRLGLLNPPLVAMGEAPDKPDPTGLLNLARHLNGGRLGHGAPPVAYLGDTVADVQTVLRARQQVPDQTFLSLAVAPPHLHGQATRQERFAYERQLVEAGADRILDTTSGVVEALIAEGWLHQPLERPPAAPR